MPAVPRKVFVLNESDPEALRRLTLLIKSFGWPVEGFASSSTCLSAVLQETPDCIIVDLDSSDRSVTSLVQTSTAQNTHVPVIIVTTMHYQSALIAQALEAGAATVLLKPYSEHDLIRTVQRVVQSQSTVHTW